MATHGRAVSLYNNGACPPPSATSCQPTGTCRATRCSTASSTTSPTEGPDALPGAGRGHPRAARRAERHPQHADRLGQVARRVGDALRRARARASAPSTPARSRRWSTRSGWRCAASSARSSVGLSTGDATVNRDAPILCCTAEILANIALREGADADVDDVVMDEFHYYADRDRGVAWQVPLLTLPQTRFLLMSATLGDTRVLRGGADARSTAGRRSPSSPATARCRSSTPTRRSRSPHTLEKLVDEGKTPVYVVHFTQADAAGSAQDFTSLKICTREEKAEIADAHRRLRVHAARTAPTSASGCGTASACTTPGLLPKYRVLVEQLAQRGPAQGHLRHRHARRRHQRADPHGAVHAALQVRRPEDGAS